MGVLASLNFENEKFEFADEKSRGQFSRGVFSSGRSVGLRLRLRCF